MCGRSTAIMQRNTARRELRAVRYQLQDSVFLSTNKIAARCLMHQAGRPPTPTHSTPPLSSLPIIQLRLYLLYLFRPAVQPPIVSVLR